MDDEVEIVLPGGMGSGGGVVRVGDTVRRPRRDFTDTVNGFLRHLHDVGFEGVPVVFGDDEQGRSVLSYIEGDVGIPPFPRWTADDDLLVSVAELQHSMHRAAASFVPPVGAVWDRINLPPAPTTAIVCHNDLCVENVVVRDHRAVGFIDFDFAAPNDPLIDIAIAARHWVPFKDPVDLEPSRADIDPIHRFRLFCDGHQLTADERHSVVTAAMEFLDRALISMKAKADSGLVLYQQVWEQGYPQQNRRSRSWLDAQATAMTFGS
jgi:aminoglycoside phosphotransferase (APT) family kinase protein